MATVFVQGFIIFHSISREFFAYHCGHFLQKTEKQKTLLLGFASLLAELKQLSVPKIGLKWTIDHGGRRSDVLNW